MKKNFRFNNRENYIKLIILETLFLDFISLTKIIHISTSNCDMGLTIKTTSILILNIKLK